MRKNQKQDFLDLAKIVFNQTIFLSQRWWVILVGIFCY